MSLARLVRRRARTQPGLVAAVFAAAAIAAAALSAIPAFADAGLEQAMRQAVADAPAESAVLTVTTRPAADPAAQDEAATRFFDAHFAGGATVRHETIAGSDAGRGFVRWTIAPNDAALDSAGIGGFAAASASLGRALEDAEGIAVSGVVVEGGLAALAAELVRGRAAQQAVTPAPVLIVLVLAAVAAWQLGRLLAVARAGETRLLRARGATPSQLGLLAAAEAAAPTLLGALAGLLLAALCALAGPPGAADGVLAGWPIAVGAAVLVAVLAAVPAWLAGRRAGSDAVVSRGLARGATAGAVVLVGLAAAASVWQLRFHGSAVVGEGAAARLDPLAALAPALALAAAGVAGLAVFAAVTAIVERPAGSPRGLLPALPARQLARHRGAFAVPVMLVVFAVGGLVLAGASTGGGAALANRTAELAGGAEVRAAAVRGELGPTLLGAAREAPGVTAAAPALLADLVVGDDAVRLVALPPAQLPAVLLSGDGAIDPLEISAQLAAAASGSEPGSEPGAGAEAAGAGAEAAAGAAAGVPLGDDATGVEARFDAAEIAPAHRADIELAAWVSGASGLVTRVPLDVAVAGASAVGTAPLPEGDAPYAVVAFDALVRSPLADSTAMRFVAADAIGPAGARPLELDPAVADGLPLSRTFAEAAALATPPVPAVVSAEFAARFDAGPGSVVDYRIDGSGRRGSIEVVGVAAAVPGAGARLAVLAALPELQRAMLATGEQVLPAGEVWASGGADAASGLAGLPGVAAVSLAQAPAAANVAASANAAWWIGVAGAVLLAAAGVAASASALGRGRLGELAVLRTLGVSARSQAAGRALELGWTSAWAIALGAVLGFGVAWLVAPPLARSAVPGATGADRFAVDLAPVVAGVAVLVALLAAIALVAVLQTARLARTVRPAEAER